MRDIYRQWRPTPLYRARRLEKALDTPARIYYKYEGVSPGRQPQAEHRGAAGLLQQGSRRQALTTETGAGQWGSSLAFAGALFGLEVKVYMVRVSYDQKPYRRALMETYGARCIAIAVERDRRRAAPSSRSTPTTRAASASRSPRPSRSRRKRDDTKYALGSVLNHVLLHQTVIGLEAMEQMEMAGDYPDVVIGCTGGGSNFAGIAFPFLGAKLRGGKKVRIVAVEPAACPSLDARQVRLRLRRHRRT